MTESPLSQFVRIWCHPSYPPASVRQTELETVEKHFGFLLPESYKREVLTVGLPRPTGALLNSIVELEIELADVSNFLSPAEIVEHTEGWRKIGLPKSLVAFATDCSGNLFAFECEKQGDCAIWYFDHDSVEVNEAAASFANWVERFCLIEPVAE